VVAAHITKCAVDVLGLGHDVQPGLGFQQLAQASADDRMVVGDHHPDRLLSGRL
jgi:hypothetical protein